MSNLQNWTLLVGALLPPLIAFIQRPGWSDRVRSVITVVVCVIVGAVATYLEGDGLQWDGDLIGASLRVLLAAQATYIAFWKPTRIAPAIETATTPRAARRKP
jgi:hypothetical protein